MLYCVCRDLPGLGGFLWGWYNITFESLGWVVVGLWGGFWFWLLSCWWGFMVVAVNLGFLGYGSGGMVLVSCCVGCCVWGLVFGWVC